MNIIVDNRIPQGAKIKLSEIAMVMFFETNRITYPSICSHPDIFFVQTENGLVIAPNLPGEMKNILSRNKISFEEGKSEIGLIYPQTAAYNAVFTQDFFIHQLKITDSLLLSRSEHLDRIHVNQAYTRCNLLALKNNHFITSDRGIEKVLKNRGLFVLFVNPEEIILPGMKNGFFGGCCGILDNTIFIIGNLDYIEEGKAIRKFIKDLGYKIVELYDGPLFDGGSLFFIV